MVTSPQVDRVEVLRDVGDAERYVAGICFKTGPPSAVGVELEWTVHHAADPARPVSRDCLRTALGRYAPDSLGAARPAHRLPAGGVVTVEPGGQLEISTAPQRSLSALANATEHDIAELTELLRRAGLVVGATGIDPYRPPRPVVDTPRYRAMRGVFDRAGPAGRTMMYSTAGLQVCLDAGEPAHLAARWAALHAYGPPLLAAFATADRHAGRATGWASARMGAWLRIDPARTRPVWTPGTGGTPALAWARYALAAPLLCVRRDGDDWTPPAGVTFADWIGGALPGPPSTDDLDYHLSTLFPPVRPRGYLEVRYLDAQPAGRWFTPVAVLAALLADPVTVDRARDICRPVAERWYVAARHGLADPALARAAAALLDLALRTLARLDLTPELYARTSADLRRRIAAAERRHT